MILLQLAESTLHKFSAVRTRRRKERLIRTQAVAGHFFIYAVDQSLSQVIGTTNSNDGLKRHDACLHAVLQS